MVARRLRDSRLTALRVVEHQGEPVDLIEQWSGAEQAIVVDAVHSGAEPGTIHALDAARRVCRSSCSRDRHTPSASPRPSSWHGPWTACRTHLLVYGIEGESFSAGRGLTRRSSEPWAAS